MSHLLQDPVFWTAVAFVIFVVLMYRPLKKALLGALDGRIEQIGTPDDLYFRPASIFAADFLGESNLLSIHAGRQPVQHG